MRLRRPTANPDAITEELEVVSLEDIEPGCPSPVAPAFESGRRSIAPDLERHLFRLGVDQLSSDRTRCCDCGRTPLIGEDVHLYERAEIVCELCRQLRPTAPVSTARVRHADGGLTVRVITANRAIDQLIRGGARDDLVVAARQLGGQPRQGPPAAA